MEVLQAALNPFRDAPTTQGPPGNWREPGIYSPATYTSSRIPLSITCGSLRILTPF